MSRATVTVRELKNKETGIDLSVTSFKETKGMIGSSFEYQVVVVSNLSCFKSAKHKETDNVQFTIMKKLPDFEDLHAKFNAKFSGTALPQLPKKVLLMNVDVAKERRNTLDYFVKFLACTPKLSTDTVLLEFLGVSSVKAGKLQKMEVSESIVNKQDDTNIVDAVNDTENVEDDTNDDLFGDNNVQNDDDDEDLFGQEELSTDKDVKIFDDQDFSGALEDGEGDDLFIVGARSEVKVISKATDADQEENNEDLFKFDDDLENIMKMKITTKTDDEREAVNEINDDIVDEAEDSKVEEDTSKNQIDSVPVTKPLKPALKAKPALPKRKDKNVDNKDSNKDAEKESVVNDSKDVKAGTKPKPPLKKKPDIAGKPNLKPKPSLKPKPVLNNEKVSSGSVGVDTVRNDDATSEAVEQISTEDDIMKYIQDNAANEDEVDLFS